jgi:hypothetical protein
VRKIPYVINRKSLRWANTVLGNLKCAIAGTSKSVRLRYAFRYLAEFHYKFNCRFYPAAMLDRVVCAAVQTAAMSYKTLKMAHGTIGYRPVLTRIAVPPSVRL